MKTLIAMIALACFSATASAAKAPASAQKAKTPIVIVEKAKKLIAYLNPVIIIERR